MKKFIAAFALILVVFFPKTLLAGPVELEKSSDDDMKTSETFGYGYYQPGLYAAGSLANAAPYHGVGAPLANYHEVGAPVANVATYSTAPLAATSTLISSSSGNARSAYGYGSGYKYGGGYGYGSRWGYGSGGAATNEYYRRHPVYVAWG